MLLIQTKVYVLFTYWQGLLAPWLSAHETVIVVPTKSQLINEINS